MGSEEGNFFFVFFVFFVVYLCLCVSRVSETVGEKKDYDIEWMFSFVVFVNHCRRPTTW